MLGRKRSVPNDVPIGIVGAVSQTVMYGFDVVTGDTDPSPPDAHTYELPGTLVVLLKGSAE